MYLHYNRNVLSDTRDYIVHIPSHSATPKHKPQPILITFTREGIIPSLSTATHNEYHLGADQ